MPGFLGTFASLSSGLSLILQIIILSCLAVSVLIAKKGKYLHHGYLMLVCVVLTTWNVLIVMFPKTRSLIRVSYPYMLSALVRVHMAVGVIVLAFGYYLMWRWRLEEPVMCLRHKRIMRILIVLWVLEVIGGFFVYYLLYV
jgi:uncharacterized membrane protein YozB (DUF420 family)